MKRAACAAPTLPTSNTPIRRSTRPRVPGHEVVGRVIALGTGVPALWRIGQRVGVGRLGGHCNACAQCRQGRFQLCRNQPVVGATCDGGYAEMMLARGTGLVAIPEELDAHEAAPLLCAGIATFNALRKCGAGPGGRMVVLGGGKDPLSVSSGFLVGGERGIVGTMTGSPCECEKALGFSVLTGARPWVETMPLERAAEAYRRMRSGDVKFRVVLIMSAP